MPITEEISSALLMISSSSNLGIEKMISDDIHKAMAKLPQIYSIPFLRYFEGYKYTEIAKELRLPMGTIKTRIDIARKLLRHKLKMYSQF
jgi:DNA-directed RNA polymerase specialized sigma24 family protein